LLVVAPTSSGKTMVGEVAAIQAVTSGKKVAFLLPYRALVNEKFEEFTERYSAAGLRVVRCSGDATDGIGPVLAGRYDLGFFTYETFLNLALGSPRLLSQLGLVVLVVPGRVGERDLVQQTPASCDGHGLPGDLYRRSVNRVKRRLPSPSRGRGAVEVLIQESRLCDAAPRFRSLIAARRFSERQRTVRRARQSRVSAHGEG